MKTNYRPGGAQAGAGCRRAPTADAFPIQGEGGRKLHRGVLTPQTTTLSQLDPVHVIGGLGYPVTHHTPDSHRHKRRTSDAADFIVGLGRERRCHIQRDRPKGGAVFCHQIVRPCDALLEKNSAAIHLTDTLSFSGVLAPQACRPPK